MTMPQLMLLLPSLCNKTATVLMRVSAIKLLKEIGPNRPDIRKRVSNFAKSVTDGNARLVLMQALGDVASSSPESSAGPSQEAVEQTEAGAGAGAAAPSAASGTPQKSALDLKREYMLARQQWIKGGKKGDPPQPPSGIQ